MNVLADILYETFIKRKYSLYDNNFQSYHRNNKGDFIPINLFNLKYEIFIKIFLKLMLAYLLLHIWNTILTNLKNLFIAIKQYDVFIIELNEKNRVIANAAKQLMLREENKFKNDRKNQQIEMNKAKECINRLNHECKIKVKRRLHSSI